MWGCGSGGRGVVWSAWARRGRGRRAERGERRLEKVMLVLCLCVTVIGLCKIHRRLIPPEGGIFSPLSQKVTYQKLMCAQVEGWWSWTVQTAELQLDAAADSTFLENNSGKGLTV